MALTYDHRILDGKDAATFLKKLATSIEDPRRILLDVWNIRKTINKFYCKLIIFLKICTSILIPFNQNPYFNKLSIRC